MAKPKVVAARLYGAVSVAFGDGVCDRPVRFVKVSRERGERVWWYLVDAGFGVLVHDGPKHPAERAQALASRQGEEELVEAGQALGDVVGIGRGGDRRCFIVEACLERGPARGAP